MKFLLTSAVLSISASLAVATVFTGTINFNGGGSQNVAYFNGDDMCSDNAPLHPNICDTVFSVDGIGGFQFHGCGTSDFVLLKDNGFNSVCTFKPQTISCPQGQLKQAFSCS